MFKQGDWNFPFNSSLNRKLN